MEQLTFCVIFLSFWSIVYFYFYCKRGNTNEADEDNIQQSSSSQNEIIEAVILNEALAVVKEQLRMDKLKKIISEALLTKCIVMNDDHGVGIIGDDCNDNDNKLKSESIGDDNTNSDIEDDAMIDVEKGQPTNILLSDMIQSHGTECIICLSPFQIRDTIAWSKHNCDTKLCKHAFHKQCISRWLMVNDECPMCRNSFCS